MSSSPLVSIVCLTYNEEEFVRDTLDSFLAQETNFPYEVLVYDDASQDKTSDILYEYANKFPDIIRLTLYPENNFKKGLGFLGLREGFKEARGKYIAYCEGDDYWCDSQKLQKQVDFLESHPEFEVCAHETRIKNDIFKQQDGTLFSSLNVNLFLNRTKRQVYSFNDTLTGNIFHVSSMMFRKIEFQWPSWICQIKAMDMVCFMLLAEKGDIYVMKDVMSVYRTRLRSITDSKEGDFKNAISFYDASIKILRLMNKYWGGKYRNNILPIISRYYIRSMFICLSKSERNYPLAWFFYKKAHAYSPVVSLKYVIIESVQKIKKHIC